MTQNIKQPSLGPRNRYNLASRQAKLHQYAQQRLQRQMLHPRGPIWSMDNWSIMPTPIRVHSFKRESIRSFEDKVTSLWSKLICDATLASWRPVLASWRPATSPDSQTFYFRRHDARVLASWRQEPSDIANLLFWAFSSPFLVRTINTT